MRTPKISVIMPAYNCEQYLASAIDSVLAQTFDNWELIICDDGSSDNTYKIAQEYAKKYGKKIVLLRNENNLKLNKTLNRCVDHSCGEYIARMDSDDLSMPERFAKQVEFLDKNVDVHVVGSIPDIIDENGFVIGKMRLPEGLVDGWQLIKGSPFCHPSIMVRRKSLLSVGAYSESKKYERVEDYDLWRKLYYKYGNTGYNVAETLLLYREDEGSFSRKTAWSRINDFRVRIEIARDIPKSNRIYILKPLIMLAVPGGLYKALHTYKNRGLR